VELTVSRPVQIFALVALLVAVAGAGMMFVTGCPTSSSRE